MIDYDPFAPEVMADPFPHYAEMRARTAAHPLPSYDAWALPRFDEVWQVLQDRERFTIAEGPVFSRAALLAPAPAPSPSIAARPLRSFSTIDPPLHTALRRAMLPPFLPRATARLEAGLRQRVRDRLDALVPAGRFDVVADLCAPVVTATTLDLLGLPSDDHGWVTDRVNRSTRRTPGEPGASPDAQRARAELHQFVMSAVQAARGRGGLVDHLAAIDDHRGAPLDDHEIAVQVGTLLVGGVETLPKIVAGGLLRLWSEPAVRAELATADESVVAGAFEEIMRLEAPLQWVGRTLLVDTTIGGHPMRAGQRVFCLLASANRDEREFADPERFDVGRRPRRTLVFGHGVHVCIGAHAARLEGRVLLEETLRRLPRYAIDTAGIERPPSEFQLGYTAMPLVVG